MKRKLLNKIKIPILIIIIDLLLYLSGGFGLFKKMQTTFFPCTNGPYDSAPCEAGFALILFLILFGIFILSIISIIIISIIHLRTKKL